MPNHYSRRTLARTLILDELFDLTLYKRLRRYARGETVSMLDQLIPVETRHVEFWQNFFGKRFERLDPLRRIKLVLILGFARVFGDRGIHLVLEAIEIYGIRKYLKVWETYKDDPLGSAVRGVLEDEFTHEDEIVSRGAARKIHPERIRNVFLGLNDGLVEMLGAVSGFFAAFETVSAVLVAALTVAVAGSISMAAGVFVAVGSEKEVENIDTRKKEFLGEDAGKNEKGRTLGSAAIVGVFYFAGAMMPMLPVLFGAENLFASILAAGIVVIIVSSLLAFLSGMNVARRIAVNLAIMAFAVAVTYAIGVVAKTAWEISI